MVSVVFIFDWKDQNGSLDQMAEVEIFGFDSIVLKVYFYLVLNICIYWVVYVVFKKMEHKSP